MHALIDADLIVHRVGYTTNEEAVDVAYFRANEMIEQMLADVKADEYTLYLSDARENNFRFKINPDYKGNRKQERPVHYDALKEWMKSEWKAQVAEGMEADDAISIAQTADPENTIGLTIDKDILFQVIGHKYNFVKQTFSYVDEVEALRYFYLQMIIGDPVDNLKGVDGLGKVKAGKFLSPYETEEEMYKAVAELYADPARFIMNGDCFWMLREHGVPFSQRKLEWGIMDFYLDTLI